MTYERIVQLALESATDRHYKAMKLYERFSTFENLKYLVDCEYEVNELKKLISPYKLG